MTTNKKRDRMLDTLEYEIMDWFYDVIKINFDTEMIQDATDLREILVKSSLRLRKQERRLFKQMLLNAQKEIHGGGNGRRLLEQMLGEVEGK